MRCSQWMMVCGLLAACAGSDKAADTGRDEGIFPASFRFGSATAGFQVDMGCPTWSAAACDDTASDWYQYVTDPVFAADSGLYLSGDPVSMGPGMWELYEDDIAQMKADGHTSYRLSVEWSRLFPARVPDSVDSVDALGESVNADAVARYHEIFAALADAGIRPLVTVNHYSLPLWLHNGAECYSDLEGCADRGWLDRDRMVHHAELYAGFLGREFGGEVDHWVTLNEPFATTLSGYLSPGEDRSAPPGVSFEVDATVAVMLNQMDGHAALYDGIRGADVVDADGDGEVAAIGIVMNMTDITPADPAAEKDVLGASHMDYLYHQLYLDAFTSGAWDADLDGVAETTRPELAGRLDFIGINYYNEVVVTGTGVPLVTAIPIFDFVPAFSWEPHPEGLAKVIARASVYGLPIDITENGTPYVEDLGESVLNDHLSSLADALTEGHPVRSYHYWSWVDNYEWNHGFDLRFGLYALDDATKAREARPVAVRYREIIANRDL